jgi:hypothetical protein
MDNFTNEERLLDLWLEDYFEDHDDSPIEDSNDD